MTIERDLRAFATGLPACGSLLALDISKRRLGIAGTDLDRRLVTPLLTCQRGDWPSNLATLRELVARRSVVGLVVGWPLSMDDSEGPACQSVLAIARQIDAVLLLPTLFQDERLTSFAVEEALAEGRLKRPAPGHPLDHYAAAVILEDALRAIRAVG